jgi:hypothetical protein
MRFVARFFVIAAVLSVLIDLTAQIAFCFNPTRSNTLLRVLVCVPVRVVMLNFNLEEASLAGLLWHYLPAIVVSLLITIAWTLKLPTKGHMNMAPLPLLRHPALRFAVLLFVLAVLYDLSKLLSSCFKLYPPFGSEAISMCFLYEADDFISIARYTGLLGLLWHYLPVIVAATIVMNSWGWDGKDCPERRK